MKGGVLAAWKSILIGKWLISVWKTKKKSGWHQLHWSDYTDSWSSQEVFPLGQERWSGVNPAKRASCSKLKLTVPALAVHIICFGFVRLPHRPTAQASSIKNNHIDFEGFWRFEINFLAELCKLQVSHTEDSDHQRLSLKLCCARRLNYRSVPLQAEEGSTLGTDKSRMPISRFASASILTRKSTMRVTCSPGTEAWIEIGCNHEQPPNTWAHFSVDFSSAPGAIFCIPSLIMQQQSPESVQLFTQLMSSVPVFANVHGTISGSARRSHPTNAARFRLSSLRAVSPWLRTTP
jgi:hypothetical protein